MDSELTLDRETRHSSSFGLVDGGDVRPGLSVCIVFRNEEANLLRCLTSIEPPDSALYSDWEILLVDNQSADRSLDVIAEFSRLNPQIAVRVLEARGNNMAQSRTRAVRASRFDRIAFIDADCEAPARWASSLMKALEERRARDPRVIAVGGGQVPPTTTNAFHQALSVFFASPLSLRDKTQLHGVLRNASVHHLATCNALFDRAALESIGHFDVAFSRVCEDVDLGWRLSRAGHRLEKIADLDVIHHHHPDLESWCRKIFRYSLGQLHLTFIHGRHRSIQLLTPLALGLALAAIGFFRPLALAGLAVSYTLLIFLLAAFSLPKHSSHRVRRLFFLIMIGSHVAAIFGQMYGLLRPAVHRCSRRRSW